MCVGRGGRGPWPPLDFEIFSKKVIFLVLSGKKQISPLLVPLWKNFGKIRQWAPLKKILSTPMTVV